MTEESEKDTEAQAREKLEKDKETRAQQAAEIEARNNWRPTPTQEEADLVAMGVPVDQVGHKDDGSGPDPHTRAMWPAKKPGGGYESR
jgi:hypothetical protein